MSVVIQERPEIHQLLPPAPEQSLAGWISAMSRALDMAEGLPAGHCRRACWIAMHIADRMALDAAQRADLYYTVLLKDIGCTSNAARLFEIYSADDLQLKADFHSVDSQNWVQLLRYVAGHVTPHAPVRQRLARLIWIARRGKALQRELIIDRCERGAALAGRMGLSASVADAIMSLDEHFNGRGNPNHLAAAQIPILSRIALAAQIAEVFYSSAGPAQATRQVCNRSGTTLDPGVVRAFLSVSADGEFWKTLERPDLPMMLEDIFPPGRDQMMDTAQLTSALEVLADVLDAKSPALKGHSRRVGRIAQAMAEHMNLSSVMTRNTYHAALLHDIGKLAISNAILDKPQSWNTSDILIYRRHVALSVDIISGLPMLAPLVPMVAMHHERLDGTGFPNHLTADMIPLGARMIAVADAYDHLCRNNPQMPPSRIMSMLKQDAGLDQNAVAALGDAAVEAANTHSAACDEPSGRQM
jgi:HD-GYP domain-containing protein (c-di-GMP phosphodiesterase class II)